MNVSDFIKALSEVLKITEPQIDHDVSHFKTNTQMACVTFPNREIHIRKDVDVNYDLFFAIAHEMRHIWQYDYKKYDFNLYINNSANDTEGYNNQDIEIDAHAFSILIMKNMFKMRPQIENVFDSHIIMNIEKRMNEIEKEIYKIK